MIRVDHAGERGADVIYNGQWDVLKDTDSGDLIKVRLPVLFARTFASIKMEFKSL